MDSLGCCLQRPLLFHIFAADEANPGDITFNLSVTCILCRCTGYYQAQDNRNVETLP